MTAIECLHYALNLPTSVVITGIDSMEILDQAFKAIETFQPLEEQAVESTAGQDGKRRHARVSSSYLRQPRFSTVRRRIPTGSGEEPERYQATMPSEATKPDRRS